MTCRAAPSGRPIAPPSRRSSTNACRMSGAAPQHRRPATARSHPTLLSHATRRPAAQQLYSRHTSVQTSLPLRQPRWCPPVCQEVACDLATYALPRQSAIEQSVSATITNTHEHHNTHHEQRAGHTRNHTCANDNLYTRIHDLHNSLLGHANEHLCC